MEETSPIWTDFETPGSGTSAPPSTPVEYFNEVYGPGLIDGNEGAGGWLEFLGDVAENLGCTEENEAQEGRKTTVRTTGRSEGAASSCEKVRPGVETEEGRISKKPRGKPRGCVFRGCARCATINHNRRLFCLGCYGSKDVMKGKKEE